nr:MAG TPA: putative periplasmic lipoprotein [Caudoviricetes sp.]
MKKALDCVYRIFEKFAAIGSDKYLHLIAGLIIAFVLGRLFANVEAWAFPAITGVLLLMVAKECVDYYLRDEQFDLKDVSAGLVGAVVGVLMCLL